MAYTGESSHYDTYPGRRHVLELMKEGGIGLSKFNGFVGAS